MRTALLLLLISTFVAACEDSHSTIAPDERAAEPYERVASVGGSYEVTVTAETIGPNGEIWMVTGAYEVCGMVWDTVQVEGMTAHVWWRSECAPSQFSAPDYEDYNGGIVNVGLDTDSGVEWLGWVSGDRSQMGEAFDIPAAAGVHLSASLEPGCEVSKWQVGLSETYGGTQYYVPAGGPTEINVVFRCGGSGGGSTGGGTSGPGDGDCDPSKLIC